MSNQADRSTTSALHHTSSYSQAASITPTVTLRSSQIDQAPRNIIESKGFQRALATSFRK
jgi:hypothetical protein